LKIKALPNKAIVKFLPFRHHGVLDIPDWHEPPSIEAEMIADGGGKDCPTVKKGTIVYVSRMVGEYFHHEGEKLCMVPRDALMMMEESK
jgi:hypothetical protein